MSNSNVTSTGPHPVSGQLSSGATVRGSDVHSRHNENEIARPAISTTPRAR